MALQGSGEISLGDIANEFGYTHGGETRLGSYRTTNGQGNFPVTFGALTFNSIDAQSGGSVPTSGQIKLSDFYSTKLQQIVNFYGSGRGGNRLVAKDRYNAGGSNDVDVVGNYRTPPSSTANRKVHIHVNQTIGSEKNNLNHCALRTGSWDPSTILQVDVGGSGRISGGGGDGGNGSTNSGTGFPGTDGTSALGVQYSPTTVNVASGGFLVGGFGGGGGGGGGFDHDKNSDRTATGGGGGGGAGIPAGSGGAGGVFTGDHSNTRGSAGDPGNATAFGEGGPGSSNDGECSGGAGGDGGAVGSAAAIGGEGDGGERSESAGGQPGGTGAAIRKPNNSFSVTLNNSGTVEGSTSALGVL